MTSKLDVVRFLQKNGVKTQFVSIVDDNVYINNLKLSRFSRKKEELFLEIFPDYEVRRSKVFQKICTRASRVLKTALSPRDRILLSGSQDCYNLTMHIVLESYTRKYGVELILSDEVDELGVNELDLTELHAEETDADTMALPLTLDAEVENILGEMLDGEKLELLSSQTQKNGMKVIYPLINVPRSWIKSWVKIESLNCTFDEDDGLPREMLEFLESFIPDVREKMIRSAVYLSRDE